jgi:hypothetical protein
MQSIALQAEVDAGKTVSLRESFGVTTGALTDNDMQENAPWLGTVHKVHNFKPLKREELYDR